MLKIPRRKAIPQTLDEWLAFAGGKKFPTGIRTGMSWTTFKRKYRTVDAYLAANPRPCGRLIGKAPRMVYYFHHILGDHGTYYSWVLRREDLPIGAVEVSRAECLACRSIADA